MHQFYQQQPVQPPPQMIQDQNKQLQQPPFPFQMNSNQFPQAPSGNLPNLEFQKMSIQNQPLIQDKSTTFPPQHPMPTQFAPTFNQPPGQMAQQPPPIQGFALPPGQMASQPPPPQGFAQPPGQMAPQPPPPQGFAQPPGQMTPQPPPPQGFTHPPGQMAPQPPPSQGFAQPPGQMTPQIPPIQGFAQPPGQMTPQIPPTQGFNQPPSFPSQFPTPPSFNQPQGFQPQMPAPMPGMMPPYMQPQKTRLDPDAMPSIVQVIEDDRNVKSGLFQTGYPAAEYPPFSSTEFVSQDQGNSNPKFIRSTIYAIPQNSDMIKTSQIPLSLAISPVGRLSQGEYAPPIINLGTIGPVRCQRCKAYMCPFMEFIDAGRKFRCPFCKANTTIEDAYFAHLDHTGRRTDYGSRPELYLGSYEFVATEQYCKNGNFPKEPAFIFMLDVSYNSVKSGLLDVFCKNIVEILRNLPKEVGADKSVIKIGLATFDQTIHFYNLSQRNYSQMMVVTDVSDIFVPFIDGFLVEFSEAEQTLISCLTEIEVNFSNTRITETTLGPVIQAGIDALKSSDRTGKIFVFSTSLPSIEAPGQLKNREDRKLLGTDKEKTILSPVNEFYGKLGEQCVQTGCAVDLFFFPNQYIDIASIAPVASISGGSIYKYQFFDAERDAGRFLNDLKMDVSRDIIFDVMMRLRTSTGLRPTGYFGNFFMQNTTDIEVGAVDCDKAFQIEIKYDDKLDEKELAYFQMATLFTSCGGQRRLRIYNIALPITSNYSDIYRLIDQDSLVTHLFKQAEQIVREKSPKEMQDEMIQKTAHILATYREKCSQSTPPGQLILPECGKLIPLYTNCIIKSDALIGGNELTVDDRAWMMSLIPSMTVNEATQFIYPRVFAVTDMTIEADGSIHPQQLRASMDYLNPEEAYLIENTMVAFLWVGSKISNSWLQAVFGVPSLTSLDSEKHELPERDTLESRSLRLLYSIINAERPRHLKLYIIKEHDGLESWMKKFLVEDKYGSNTSSYVDFLCRVHHEIRNMLS